MCPYQIVQIQYPAILVCHLLNNINVPLQTSTCLFFFFFLSLTG